MQEPYYLVNPDSSKAILLRNTESTNGIGNVIYNISNLRDMQCISENGAEEEDKTKWQWLSGYW